MATETIGTAILVSIAVTGAGLALIGMGQAPTQDDPSATVTYAPVGPTNAWLGEAVTITPHAPATFQLHANGTTYAVTIEDTARALVPCTSPNTGWSLTANGHVVAYSAMAPCGNASPQAQDPGDGSDPSEDAQEPETDTELPTCWTLEAWYDPDHDSATVEARPACLIT